VQYLPGYTSKEEPIRGIQEQQGAAPHGLVAVLSTLENCISYEIFRDRLRQAAPEFLHLFEQSPLQPYWTIEESEWATDIAFRSPQALAELYPTLIRHGIQTFDSRDVLRFLGHKVPTHGRLHPRLAKQVLSDSKDRPEGLRLKHRVGRNTLKMYDKFAQILRVETTLNEVRALKVFRRKDRHPEGPRQWLRLRKSVADMPRPVAEAPSVAAAGHPARGPDSGRRRHGRAG